MDELIRQHHADDRLFYFPSYELVKEYFPDPYQPDNRYVKPGVVSKVMQLFARFYLADFSEEKQAA